MRVKPLRFKKLSAEQIANFWKKVDKHGPDECWPWKAATAGKDWPEDGYPVQGINQIVYRATRIGWFIVHGHDPYPLHVLHSCDFRRCCNPSHWFLGTNHENIIDRNKKGRGGRKLTPSDVLEIKQLLAQGKSQQSIADNFSVNQTLIGFIKRGVAWKHVIYPQ